MIGNKWVDSGSHFLLEIINKINVETLIVNELQLTFRMAKIRKQEFVAQPKKKLSKQEQKQR